MPSIPPNPESSIVDYVRHVLPGLVLAALLGSLALGVDRYLVPDSLFFLNYVIIAIIIGILARNLNLLSPRLCQGLALASRLFLYVAVVLLGARMNLNQVLNIGSTALLVVAFSIVVTIVVAGWVARRCNADDRCGHLLGVGLGVCGISAIMATAPAIRAREDEILPAVGAALITDVLVLLTFPLMAHWLGWTDVMAGFLAGIVPSNTAQSIAVGYAYSDAAGSVATVVKSTRNALMPVVILLLTLWYSRRGLPVGETPGLRLLWTKFPKFILGLLAASLLATAGLLSEATIHVAGELTTWFFVCCFVGIGAGIHFSDLRGRNMLMMGVALPMLVFRWFLVYGLIQLANIAHF